MQNFELSIFADAVLSMNKVNVLFDAFEKGDGTISEDGVVLIFHQRVVWELNSSCVLVLRTFWLLRVMRRTRIFGMLFKYRELVR